MIIPLRITGGSQVMLILKKGGDDVMTTGPGAIEVEKIPFVIYMTL